MIQRMCKIDGERAYHTKQRWQKGSVHWGTEEEIGIFAVSIHPNFKFFFYQQFKGLYILQNCENIKKSQIIETGNGNKRSSMPSQYTLWPFAFLICLFFVNTGLQCLALNSLLVLPWIPYFYWENLLSFPSIKEIVMLKYLETMYNRN